MEDSAREREYGRGATIGGEAQPQCGAHQEREGCRRSCVEGVPRMSDEGWTTEEFIQFHPKLRDSLLKGVAKHTSPQNALHLLFAAEHVILPLANRIEPWADTVRDATILARNKTDDVVTREAQGVFWSDEWEVAVDAGGVHFDGGDRAELVAASVARGVRDE